MAKPTRLFAALVLAALSVAAAGCGGGGVEAAGGDEVTVELAEENGSGQSGTATLVPEGDGTRVTIELSNAPGEAQPAHIHPGTCADLDPKPAHPLEDVMGGSSESMEQVTLEELQNGDFAINVHKSAAEADVYVACGAIVQS